MNSDNNDRGTAVSENAQQKLVQLCSLLAALRTGAFVLEVTEETQLNLLWLAHDIALDVAHQIGCSIPGISV